MVAHLDPNSPAGCGVLRSHSKAYLQFELLASSVPPCCLAGESSSSLTSAGHAAMSAGAPQEDVLGEGESACDEVLQPQQEREEAGEQEEDDGVEVEEEEEAPTHLPFAPSSEVRAPPFPLLLRSICYGGACADSGGHSVEQLVTAVWPAAMAAFY